MSYRVNGDPMHLHGLIPVVIETHAGHIAQNPVTESEREHYRSDQSQKQVVEDSVYFGKRTNRVGPSYRHQVRIDRESG